MPTHWLSRRIAERTAGKNGRPPLAMSNRMRHIRILKTGVTETISLKSLGVHERRGYRYLRRRSIPLPWRVTEAGTPRRHVKSAIGIGFSARGIGDTIRVSGGGTQEEGSGRVGEIEVYGLRKRGGDGRRMSDVRAVGRLDVDDCSIVTRLAAATHIEEPLHLSVRAAP